MQTDIVVRVAGKTADGKAVSGTGFLVTEGAHVATCWHVVEHAAELHVFFPYTAPWPYRIVRQDPAADLAILESIVPPTAPTPAAQLFDGSLYDLRDGVKNLHFYGWSSPDYYNTAQKMPCWVTAFAEVLGTIGLNADANPGDSGAPVVNDEESVVGVLCLRDRKRIGHAMMIPADQLLPLVHSIDATALPSRAAPLSRDVLQALGCLSRQQFERVLLILGFPQSSLPRYDAGQDARARALWSAASRPTREQIVAAIADVQRQSTIGASVRDTAFGLVSSGSRRAYEFLVGHHVVAEPIERRALEEYHQDLAQRMERDNAVQLIEQSVGTVDDGRFEPDPFMTSAPRGVAVRRIRHLLRLLTGLSEGGDQSSAQLASMHRRSKVVRDAVATLLRAERPVILLGEPGSGKSMTLREVARDLVRRRTAGPRPPVVVYVRLGAFKSASGGAAGDVVELIRSQIPPRFQSVREAVPTFIAESRLIAVFDGMDEMERHGYNDRVRALSRFASEHEHSVRTLFSCRINDFTPEFRHHQLVLLPFGDSQISQFVRRNVRLPLTVDDQPYRRHTELIRGIRKRPGIAELVNNPLMLFLTCRYLVAEGRWPRSRASLFRSYIQQHLRQMADEGRLSFAEGEPESLLAGWSSMAFDLMLRARGDLSVGEADPRTIEVGRRAGILQIDTDDEERVRFAHHRFQEFFAARHLMAAGHEIVDWSRVLDLPNWQETLLNLASLQPQCVALTQLQESIARPSQELEAKLAAEAAARAARAEARKKAKEEAEAKKSDVPPADAAEEAPQADAAQANESEVPQGEAAEAAPQTAAAEANESEVPRDEATEAAPQTNVSPETDAAPTPETEASLAATPDEPAANPLPWPLDADEERRWADRVLLASHVVRDAAAEAAVLPQDFETDFRQALTHLATFGRPTSQVKMIWSWKNAPGRAVMEALDEPVNSTIGWVRNQAILLIGAIGEGDVSRNVAVDLTVDLAAERVLGRTVTYLRAARASGPRWVMLAIIAALCQAGFFVSALAFAGFVALVCGRIAAHLPLLSSRPLVGSGIALALIVAFVPLYTRRKPIGVSRGFVYSSWWTLFVGVVLVIAVAAIADKGSWLGVLLGVGVVVAGVVGLLRWVPAALIELAFWPFAIVFLLAVRIAVGSVSARAARRLLIHSPAEQSTRETLGSIGWLLAVAVLIGGFSGFTLFTDWVYPILKRIGVVTAWDVTVVAGKWALGVLLAAFVLFLVGTYLVRAKRPLWKRLAVVASWVLITGLVGAVFAFPELMLGVMAVFFGLLLLAFVLDANSRAKRLRRILIIVALPVLAVTLWTGMGSLRTWLTALAAPLTPYAPTLTVMLFAVCVFVFLTIHYAGDLRRLFHVRRRVWQHDWTAAMSTGDARLQKMYLQVDRSRFLPHPLTAADYLALLQSVEALIKEDPAATEYWLQRQQMEQAVRQELRDGSHHPSASETERP
jgi:hypothetical protein